MLSLATRIPVRADVAMTGEVTLRGRVLPVGGVRDKALAALRAGISRVIVPKANMRDLKNIPKDLKRRMTFIPVEHMYEVLDAAFEQGSAQRQRGPKAPPARLSSGEWSSANSANSD